MTARLIFGVLLVSMVMVYVKACCVPDQWEGRVGFLGGVASGGRRDDEQQAELTDEIDRHHHHHHGGHSERPKILLKGSNFSYDATNKRFATATCNHHKGSIRTIADYKAKKYYVIFSIKNSTYCKYFKLKKAFEKACTGNTTHHMDGKIGVGDDGLAFTNYAYFKRGLASFVSVTKKSCAPISEAGFGHFSRKYFIMTVGYSDITAGIKDPSIFTPPKNCKPAKESEEDLLMQLEVEKVSSNFLNNDFHY